MSKHLLCVVFASIAVHKKPSLFQPLFPMKTRILLFTIAFISFLSFAFVQNKPTRIVFFGDSITRQGVGPEGYITQMNKMLESKGLGSQYELIGAGIGGNKIYDLYLRLEEDVLAKKPDVVVIYVGINDVWHKSSSGTGTDPDKFVRFYQAVIKKIKDQGARIVICTPTVIGERYDNSNQQDGDLNHYGSLVRELAKEQKLELVDLRSIFQKYLADSNPDNRDRNILTTDRVHLNEAGNTLVAKSMLEVLIRK
jgi:lysophospholipase L1-like esterase